MPPPTPRPGDGLWPPAGTGPADRAVTDAVDRRVRRWQADPRFDGRPYPPGVRDELVDLVHNLAQQTDHEQAQENLRDVELTHDEFDVVAAYAVHVQPPDTDTDDDPPEPLPWYLRYSRHRQP